jgi:hypothetical protein
MEKEIQGLELDTEKDCDIPKVEKPEPVPEIKKTETSKKKAKKAKKMNNRKAEKSKAELAKERADLVKALKVKKAEKIRSEMPANTTAKSIADMKKLSEFISVRIKRYNGHDAPLSEKMAAEDIKYTIEKMYKHLQNSFIDWEYEEELDVCRVLDLPCHGKSFGKDIEDHLSGQEHMVSILHNP